MRSAAWLHLKQSIKARFLRPLLWLQLLVNWLVYLLSATVSLVTLTLILAFFWLLASEAGGSWLLRQLPGVQVEEFSGQLIGHWQAEQLSWQQEGLALTLDQVSWNWQPWCLFSLTLCIEDLEAEALDISLAATAAAQPQDTPATNAPFLMPDLELPSINLPLTLRLDQLQLGQFSVNQQPHLTQLQVQQLNWSNTQLQWQQLSLQSPWLPLDADTALQAQGRLDMSGDWPLELAAQAHIWEQAVQAKLAGSLQSIQIQQLTLADEQLSLSGELALFTPTLPAQLQLQVQTLSAQALFELAGQEVPAAIAAAEDQLLVDQLQLELVGDLEAGWQINSFAQLLLADTPYLLDLSAQVDWQGLLLQELSLASHPQHRLSLSGGYQWAEQTAQLNLDWQDFLGGQLPWQIFLDAKPQLPVAQEQLALQLNWQAQQLYLGGGLTSQLLWQGDTAQLNSRFAAHLDLSQVPKPAASTALPEQLLAWAEQLDLGLEVQLSSELERLGYHWDSQLELDFLWQGETQDYWLNMPYLSLDGAGDEHLQASLRLNKDLWQANLTANLTDLDQLTAPWPIDLAGDLVLTARASLPGLVDFKRPDALVATWQDYLLEADYRLSFSTEELVWQQARVQETALTLEYSGFTPRLPGQQPLSLRLLSRALSWQEQSLSQVQVRTRGTAAQHQLTAQADYQQQPLSFAIQGGLQTEQQGLQLHYQLAPWDSQQLAGFLPENLNWQGQLLGELELAWLTEGWSAAMQLVTQQGRFSVLQVDELEQTETWVDLDYQHLGAQLTLNPDTAALQLRLAGEDLGQTEIDLALALTPEVETGQRPLGGRYLLAETQLQLFLPFLELDELSGYLAGQGHFAGYLDAPEIWGELEVKQLLANDLEWPLSLNRLDARLLLQAREATLEGHFEAGREGQGQLAGRLFWNESLQAEISLEAANLAVRVEPWASLEIHPQLEFRLNQGQASLSGQIAIPRGEISVQQLPQQAVRVSADARVINRPEPEPGPIKAFNLDIELLLGRDRVALDAFGLVADLQGRLRVTDELATHGELRLLDGRYQSFGQDLRLRRAQLNFNGPMDLPFLDIEAIRQVGEVTAGLRITGRVDQAETEIFSEPPMSSEQALSWLLTGAPLEAETDPNMLALSLGLAGVSDYTRAAGEVVGLRDLELSAEGDGEEASLVASAYLNRRLSVRYGVGIYDDISRVALRYELTRRLYIEVVSSIENSLDIYWEVDY